MSMRASQAKLRCALKPGQRGIAIIMAMAIVTLAALAATAIIVTQSTWARHAQLANDHAQAQLLIRTGLDWARAVLSDDLLVSAADHPGEPWALVLPALPVENGSLLGHIEEQQGRFNLNNLLRDGSIDVAQLAALRRLLTLLRLPTTLAATLADWVDTDSAPQPGGAVEDAFASNRPLQDIAELADVAGFDAAVRTRLRPYITALPGYTALNANTASAEVLAALVSGLGLDGARALVAGRQRAYFRNYADFSGQLPAALLGTSGASEESITVSSDFFIASAQVSFGGAQARGSALLVRSGSGWPRVLWRKLL